MSHAKSLILLTNSLHHRLFSVRLLSTGNTIAQRERQHTQNIDKDDGLRQDGEEFRKYEIVGLKDEKGTFVRRKKKIKVSQPRYKQMSVDQDWTNVWPTASTFKWATIPFPVRQGYIDNQSENGGIIPSRYGNVELMKIPNFLHLSPAHVKKQCKAIKEFCNPWPAGLETDEKCDKYFPINVLTRNYCFSSSTVKDERSRIVTVKVKLSDLKLDYHGEDKIKRLLGDKYNTNTDKIILTTNRCPLKKQNYEYAMYLLTAVYHEAKKVESWESDMTEDDANKYFWENSRSKKNIVTLLHRLHISDTTRGLDEKGSTEEDEAEDKILQKPEVKSYGEAVTDLHNEGENYTTINRYKNSVLQLFQL